MPFMWMVGKHAPINKFQCDHSMYVFLKPECLLMMDRRAYSIQEHRFTCLLLTGLCLGLEAMARKTLLKIVSLAGVARSEIMKS